MSNVTVIIQQDLFATIASPVLRLLGLGLSLLLVTYLTTLTYSAFFHPLSKYPGPKLAAASFLPLWYHRFTEDYNPWITALHARYGTVVRFSPDGLSFISPSAWRDIYGPKIGGKQPNAIDPRFYSQYENGEDDITTTADEARHMQLRRLFSHAFSSKAAELQEPLLHRHVDMMIARLRKAAASDAAAEIEIVNLLNRTTFDIMGDLAFGESLELLENDTYMPWITAMYGAVRVEVMCDVVSVYPILRKVAGLFVSKTMKAQQEEHYAFTGELIKKRLERGRDEPDIWNLMYNNGLELLSMTEMHNNASAFMMAGTETTSTTLSGLTYLLLRNRRKLEKVVAEVRALDDESMLNLAVLTGLPYLNACFNEALRVYPPAPEGTPRVIPPGGNVISGEHLPANTRVTIPQWTINHSPLYFKDPDSFIPERWLPNSGFESDVREVVQPFSVGHRGCIGKTLAYQEMRLIYGKLLWYFDLELCERSSEWMKQKSCIQWDRKPMYVRIKMRDGIQNKNGQ